MITKALLYCTKNYPMLYKNRLGQWYVDDKKFIRFVEKQKLAPVNYVNGHVVAVCDIEVEEIGLYDYQPHYSVRKMRAFSKDGNDELLKKSCLSLEQLSNYLLSKNDGSIFAKGYAIHIKNLKAFDEPLTIEKLYQPIDNNFCKGCREYKTCEYAKSKGKPCKKVLLYAPQNMCYVGYNGEKYALISIQPQWLVKILNGEKTIEVRKKVLRDMLCQN